MKKILVIGAGAYQVPLIKRIIEIGYEAYCVDRNANAPGFGCSTGYRNIDVTDSETCLMYAKELEIDAVMTYGAVLPLTTVAYIAEALNLPALNPKTAKIAQNKYEIKKRLCDMGCNIKGEFFQFNTLEEAYKYNYTLPCVIKPSDGSGSKGVSIVYDKKEIKNALTYSFSSARYSNVYVEPYIIGNEYSVEAFVENQKIHIYAIIKTTFTKHKNGDISYGHMTPAKLSENEARNIRIEVEKAIKALNINMYSVNFDIIVEKSTGKPYIIDCGVRIGQNLISSHLIPFSRGVSVIDNTIDLALGNKIEAEPKYEKCVATRLLIYKPGVIKEIKPFYDLIDNKTVLDIVLKKNVGDKLRAFQDKSDTCGWVVTSGATPEEAETNAESFKEKLRKYIHISNVLS